MRNAVIFAISASLCSTAVFAATGSPAIARPKLSLNQCISAVERCLKACPGYIDGWIAPSDSALSDANCRNQCNANHAACVDMALTMKSEATTTPPKRRLPSENILDAPVGFGTATVTPTGAPLGAAPSRATAGAILK